MGHGLRRVGRDHGGRWAAPLAARLADDPGAAEIADTVEMSQPQDARAVAEKLICAIGSPPDPDGAATRVTASVGIAIYPDDGEDVESLISRADAAMYRSKRQRAGGIAFHDIEFPGGVGLPWPPSAHANRSAHTPDGESTDADRRNDDLRETNEKLVIAVITAQELHAAAQKAQQRQKALIASVVEELRDPLVPIRMASALLSRLAPDEPLLPRLNGIVDEQMAQMSRLASTLVDASDDVGALQADSRRVNMGDLIDECGAAFAPMMDERSQSFESHRPLEAIEVQGDAARLKQIVGNLLDNASRHTHGGGRISLSAVVTADTLTLTVSDNGIGISPEMLPHVFDPLAQDPHAINGVSLGLGIGLTAVCALVRAHGGSLAAHSAGSGLGSCFVVVLPRAAGGSAGGAQRQHGVRSSKRK
jgi:diguanylate cyclase